MVKVACNQSPTGEMILDEHLILGCTPAGIGIEFSTELVYVDRRIGREYTALELNSMKILQVVET